MSIEFDEYGQGDGSVTVGLKGDVLAWVKRKGKKFDIAKGNKYKVSYDNPRRVIHKNAVGVYIGCRKDEYNVMAILDCCGKKFWVEKTLILRYTASVSAFTGNLRP